MIKKSMSPHIGAVVAVLVLLSCLVGCGHAPILLWYFGEEVTWQPADAIDASTEVKLSEQLKDLDIALLLPAMEPPVSKPSAIRVSLTTFYVAPTREQGADVTVYREPARDVAAVVHLGTNRSAAQAGKAERSAVRGTSGRMWKGSELTGRGSTEYVRIEWRERTYWLSYTIYLDMLPESAGLAWIETWKWFPE